MCRKSRTCSEEGVSTSGKILCLCETAYASPCPNRAPVKRVAGVGINSSYKITQYGKTEIWGEIETQDLSRLQKYPFLKQTLMPYYRKWPRFDLADITDVEKMRVDIKRKWKKQGVGLTISTSWKRWRIDWCEHPKFSNHLSDDNTQILIRKSVHMGFAVATPTGLMVPVIKDVQIKGIKQIAKEIGEMAVKARDVNLPLKICRVRPLLSQVKATWVERTLPLILVPQVAILGVSESTYQPVGMAKNLSPA